MTIDKIDINLSRIYGKKFRRKKLNLKTHFKLKELILLLYDLKQLFEDYWTWITIGRYYSKNFNWVNNGGTFQQDLC